MAETGWRARSNGRSLLRTSEYEPGPVDSTERVVDRVGRQSVALLPKRVHSRRRTALSSGASRGLWHLRSWYILEAASHLLFSPPGQAHNADGHRRQRNCQLDAGVSCGSSTPVLFIRPLLSQLGCHPRSSFIMRSAASSAGLVCAPST
jgi:hypothetical protein